MYFGRISGILHQYQHAPTNTCQNTQKYSIRIFLVFIVYYYVLSVVFACIQVCIRMYSRMYCRLSLKPLPWRATSCARATPHLSWVARSRGTSAVPYRVTKGTRAHWAAQWALRQLQSHLTTCSHHNRSHNTAALTTQL